MSKKIIEALETVIDGLMALKRELVAGSMEPTVRPAHKLKAEMKAHFICPDCNYTCAQTGRSRHTHIRCNHTPDFHHRWVDCAGVFVTEHCPHRGNGTANFPSQHEWKYLSSENAYECSLCYQVTYKVPTFRCPSCDFVCFGKRDIQHRHDDCGCYRSKHAAVHHIVTKGCR